MGFGPGYVLAVNSWSTSWGMNGAFKAISLLGMWYAVCCFLELQRSAPEKDSPAFGLKKLPNIFFTLSGKVGPPLKFQCYFHQCCPRGLYNALHHHLVFHGLNNPIIDRSSLPKYLRLATFLEVAPQAVDFGFFLPGRPLGTFTGSSYPMPLPKER